MFSCPTCSSEKHSKKLGAFLKNKKHFETFEVKSV